VLNIGRGNSVNIAASRSRGISTRSSVGTRNVTSPASSSGAIRGVAGLLTASSSSTIITIESDDKE
jgi:hypothetical protein